MSVSGSSLLATSIRLLNPLYTEVITKARVNSEGSWVSLRVIQAHEHVLTSARRTTTSRRVDTWVAYTVL